MKVLYSLFILLLITGCVFKSATTQSENYQYAVKGHFFEDYPFPKSLINTKMTNIFFKIDENDKFYFSYELPAIEIEKLKQKLKPNKTDRLKPLELIKKYHKNTDKYIIFDPFRYNQY